MTDMKHYESVLRGRLAELEQRLLKVETALDRPADPNSEERAIEREGDEVLEGLGNAGLSEMKMITAALERIEAGTFGVCAACGEPISEERLAAVPYATRCRSCA